MIFLLSQQSSVLDKCEILNFPKVATEPIRLSVMYKSIGEGNDFQFSPDSFTWAAKNAMPVMAGPFKPWLMVKHDIEKYTRAWQGTEKPQKHASMLNRP